MYYSKGVCSQEQTPETKGVLYKHVCVSCWSKDGKTYHHPQIECHKNTKKRLVLDMALGSTHVHKERTVINANYSSKELLSLSGFSMSEIRQRFESSLALIRHRDHRTYGGATVAEW